MNTTSSRSRRQDRLNAIALASALTQRHHAPDIASASSLPIKNPPSRLPDPWLFDSEKLMHELDRCREKVLLIPTPTHESYFAANLAIDALWNLREALRYLIALQREGQRQFAKRHDSLNHDTNPQAKRCERKKKAARRANASFHTRETQTAPIPAATTAIHTA
jgi:hypothetical protein